MFCYCCNKSSVGKELCFGTNIFSFVWIFWTQISQSSTVIIQLSEQLIFEQLTFMQMFQHCWNEWSAVKELFCNRNALFLVCICFIFIVESNICLDIFWLLNFSHHVMKRNFRSFGCGWKLLFCLAKSILVGFAILNCIHRVSVMILPMRY